MNKRLNLIQNKLKEKKLHGFIVTNPVNIFYLSGFSGISQTEREAVLVFNPKANLIAPKLYQAEARKLASKDLKISIADERNRMHDLAGKFLKNAKRIGFEANNLTFSEYTHFRKSLKKDRLLPIKNLVEEMRVIKATDEISAIEKAQNISQAAFEKLLPTIEIGQREAELAERLEKIIKNLGGQGLAFGTIVASGKNSALPHYKTGRRKIKGGDILLFDFGAKYKDYCADLTRTVFFGKAKDYQANIWHMVYTAQKKAIEKTREGVKSQEVFKVAHDLFKEQKLDKYFLHSLGHGIGLEVHEKPSVAPKGAMEGKPSVKKNRTDEERLTEGMVFSIEPGLYFENWGGVRIEDLVTIKNERAKILGERLARFIQIG